MSNERQAYGKREIGTRVVSKHGNYSLHETEVDDGFVYHIIRGISDASVLIHFVPKIRTDEIPMSFHMPVCWNYLERVELRAIQ